MRIALISACVAVAPAIIVAASPGTAWKIRNSTVTTPSTISGIIASRPMTKRSSGMSAKPRRSWRGGAR